MPWSKNKWFSISIPFKIKNEEKIKNNFVWNLVNFFTIWLKSSKKGKIVYLWERKVKSSNKYIVYKAKPKTIKPYFIDFYLNNFWFLFNNLVWGNNKYKYLFTYFWNKNNYNELSGKINHYKNINITKYNEALKDALEWKLWDI